MNTVQITEILSNDPFTSQFFKGVMSFDRLPYIVSCFPSFYIINSDVSSGTGLHWMCIFLEADKPPEFFDSLAKGLGKYNVSIENFLIRHGHKYLYNVKRLQGPYSDVCADYCILFAYFRCRGVSFERIMNMFSDNDFDANDVLVELGL